MSKSMGDQGPRIAHLVHKGKGGLAGEIADLRSDLDTGMSRLEGRDASLDYPELDYIDGTGPSAAGADMALVGRNLLQQQTFAELDKDLTHGLKFFSAKPGEADNDITVELIAGGGTAVSYVPATKVLEVTFNDGVDDDDAIATAINADAAQTDGHVRAISSSTINAASMSSAGAFGPENMTGGAGDGWECLVGGLEALPANVPGVTGTASIAEALATVTVPALAPIVATDQAKISVVSDGVRTDMSAVVQV